VLCSTFHCDSWVRDLVSLDQKNAAGMDAFKIEREIIKRFDLISEMFTTFTASNPCDILLIEWTDLMGWSQSMILLPLIRHRSLPLFSNMLGCLDAPVAVI
jgi:hypothetical protein